MIKTRAEEKRIGEGQSWVGRGGKLLEVRGATKSGRKSVGEKL